MIHMQINLNEFQANLEQLTDKLREVVPSILNQVGDYLVSKTISKISSNVPPPNAPLTVAWKQNTLTLRDTGLLMSSIHKFVANNSLYVGTDRLYAPIQQHGGTIYPKNAQKLAIPAGWNTRRVMRSKGVLPRVAITALKSEGWKIWFTEKAIMGRPPGAKKAQGQVLFVRKSSVTIPPRPFLYIDGEDSLVIKKIIKGALDGIL